MLTCKVGETILNCIDKKYDRYTFKKWSEKNILICPDCGGLYEYCHGDVVAPYFRHKEKSKLCDEIYSESESQEHILGKTKLYKWLLSLQEKKIVYNVKLEYYIPETKQKPDLYFEQDKKRYVIEYQCTPIATEFLERRELYKLAGINDIWVLGTDNYLQKEEIGKRFNGKTIEEHTQYYFDSEFDLFIYEYNKHNRLEYMSNHNILQYEYKFNRKIYKLEYSFNNKNLILNHKKYYGVTYLKNVVFIKHMVIQEDSFVREVDSFNQKIIKTLKEENFFVDMIDENISNCISFTPKYPFYLKSYYFSYGHDFNHFKFFRKDRKTQEVKEIFEMSLNTTEDNIRKIRIFLYEDLIDSYKLKEQENAVCMFVSNIKYNFNSRFLYKTNGMYNMYCKYAEVLIFKNNAYMFELESKNCMVNVHRCDPDSLVKIDIMFKINLNEIEQRENKNKIVAHLVELFYNDTKSFIDNHLYTQYNIQKKIDVFKKEKIKILFLEDKIMLDESRKFKILREYDTNIINKQILDVLNFLKNKKTKEYIIAIEKCVCRGNFIRDLDSLGINYEVIEKGGE